MLAGDWKYFEGILTGLRDDFCLPPFRTSSQRNVRLLRTLGLCLGCECVAFCLEEDHEVCHWLIYQFRDRSGLPTLRHSGGESPRHSWSASGSRNDSRIFNDEPGSQSSTSAGCHRSRLRWTHRRNGASFIGWAKLNTREEALTMIDRIKGVAVVVLAGLPKAATGAASSLWSTARSSAQISITPPDVAERRSRGGHGRVSRRQPCRDSLARQTESGPLSLSLRTASLLAGALFWGGDCTPRCNLSRIDQCESREGFRTRHYVLLSLRPFGVAG